MPPTGDWKLDITETYMETWFIVSWDDGDCRLRGPFGQGDAGREFAEGYMLSMETAGEWDPSESALLALPLVPKA